MNLNFGVQRHFQQYFSYVIATSFSGGGSRSTWREPPTLGKQLVKLYHLWLRVECTLFCNLQSWVRTHAILGIGLYDVLDPTTYLIEPPRPPVMYAILVINVMNFVYIF